MLLELRMFLSRHKQHILVIFLSLLTISLIIAAVFVVSFWKKGSFKTTTFMSSDKEISLTLEDNLGMDIHISNDSSHALLLTSASNGNTIAVSKTDKNSVYTMSDFVNADKSNYATEFENSQNVSDISQGSLKGYTYYKYSFETDESYIEVYWFDVNDNYYVIDFACDKDGDIDLKPYISSIIDTLQIENSNLSE